MYIAMNRFKVILGMEDEFHDVWANRPRHLENVPGVKSFYLLKGATTDDYTLFSSHTVWDSEEDFVAWTKSQAFRDAHKGAGDRKVMTVGGPQFEGFKVVLEN